MNPWWEGAKYGLVGQMVVPSTVTAEMAHYLNPFSVGDVGLGFTGRFDDTQLNGDLYGR